MNLYFFKSSILILLVTSFFTSTAQTTTDDLESLLGNTVPKRVYANNAFKSSRVVNGHSMEMIGKGVLDFRILHRFGLINGGWRELFGLDQASMRMGFDYGISKNITIGIGRSTFNKEVDGFAKVRILHQHTGEKATPVSLLWVSGMTMNTTKVVNPLLNDFSNRLGYYHQVIIGRKINEKISLQLSPTLIHRNMTDFIIDYNNMIALGIGTRVKISKRSAFIIDTYPILYGARENYNFFPISLGFDIETGGHVFQLHLSNARGMNEKSFISETYQNWAKGQVQLGFNLSRVFTIVKNTSTSW